MKMQELVITNQTGKDITTSLIIAEVFGKKHADVLRDVRNLHCSGEFRTLNFAECLNIIPLEVGMSRQPYFEITKDGFSFLVMGYTGEKAGKFKEDFINEFNKHEALLKNPDYILSQAQRILSERIQSFEHQLKQKNERLAIQEHEIQKAAPKVEYYDTVLQSESAIATTVIANELGMSAKYLNKILIAKQIIRKVNGVYVLFAKYHAFSLAKPRTFHYTRSDGEIGTKVELYWSEAGRKFIHDLFKKIETKS
jgi:Rha family phage regulatory protein